MEIFEPEVFEIKYQIADIASDLYVKGDGDFTLKSIANEMEITVGEIFEYFPNKRAILEFFYASFVIRYELMTNEIEGFEGYSLSEKFSNFAFASFDMLQEKKAFVDRTFKKLIINSNHKTAFEKEVERLSRKFLKSDPRLADSSILVLNDCYYSFLRQVYLRLVQFWLNDESDQQELSMELTDKLTSLMEEVMYNRILDKGFDLGKFIYANQQSFFSQIPFVNRIFSKIEIR